MKLVIGIATRGRPEVLCDTLQDISRQTRQPDEIIVAYADGSDIGDAATRFPTIKFLLSPLGLTRQRNSIIENSIDKDLLLFIDDDFYLHETYLQIIERLFLDHAQVVAATGKVLADGIRGPGISVRKAKSILIGLHVPEDSPKVKRTFNTYGCNMCFRLEPVRLHGIRFDELLPFYGWYEDVDFSRRLSPHGAIVRVSTAWGVHLGTKGGRTSGRRLGYSQIANPIYLAQKGSVSWGFAVTSAVSRFTKNLVRSLVPESNVDRRGRLLGNFAACRELLTGELCPTRIRHL
jgi:glycosyltransferase involved in cell wall biosynthesis